MNTKLFVVLAFCLVVYVLLFTSLSQHFLRIVDVVTGIKNMKILRKVRRMSLRDLPECTVPEFAMRSE
jgi:hypothetical protein